MTKEIFIKALVAGGDCGPKHAERVYAAAKESLHGFTTNLDLMLAKALLEDDSPITNLEYAMHQIGAALKVLKKEEDI